MTTPLIGNFEILRYAILITEIRSRHLAMNRYIWNFIKKLSIHPCGSMLQTCAISFIVFLSNFSMVFAYDNQADKGNIRGLCYRNEFGTAIKLEKKDAVGSLFRLRKNTSRYNYDCNFGVRSTDIVFGSDEAYTFIALINSYLILDDGTGPVSNIVIYKIPEGTKLLDATYSVQGNCEPTLGCYSSEFEFSKKTLTIWLEIKEKPTQNNCKDYEKFMTTTQAAAIEEKSQIDLSTLDIRGTGIKRCSIRQ